MTMKAKFAMRAAPKMLQNLKKAKRNGLIDPKIADDLIKNLEKSMKMAENEQKSEKK